MKTLYLLIVIALGVNISLYANKNLNSAKSDLTMAQVENLASGEDDCIAGGPGSTHCGLHGEIEVEGVKFSVDCDVECDELTYSCCSVKGCHCLQK